MPLTHRRDHAHRVFRRSGSFDAFDVVVSSTPTPSGSAHGSITPTTRTLSIIAAVLCAVVLVGTSQSSVQ